MKPAKMAEHERSEPVSLVVVGTGIEWAGQTTLAAQSAIEKADSVLFAVADPWAARWIRSLHPSAEALPYPRSARNRQEIYRAVVERILVELRKGARVCAVFYGSPAVLTQPAHDALKRARREGFGARMLAGVSSLENLFADLGVDPGEYGCQTYEASDFLLRSRRPDVHAHLVLCQPAMIGNRGPFEGGNDAQVRHGLRLLGEHLGAFYAPKHDIVLYEAASRALARTRVERIRLGELEDASVSPFTTLYLAPVGRAPLNRSILARLGSPLSRADGADSGTYMTPPQRAGELQ